MRSGSSAGAFPDMNSNTTLSKKSPDLVRKTATARVNYPGPRNRSVTQRSFRVPLWTRRFRHSSVTHPSEALFTLLMYLNSVPLVAL
jgi:hypothetical protein